MKRETEGGFSIGSDPELLIFNERDELVPASQFSSKFTLDSEIGHDGHPATLELRPQPKNCPLEHLGDIERLMKKLSNMVGVGYEVRAGSYHNGKAIGGHLHFGVKPNDDMTRALNFFLAVPTMLLESEKEAKLRRIGSRYGLLDSSNRVIAEKSYGFEYRPLASWLINREIAKGTLCLGYVIVNEYRDGDKKFNKSEYDMLLNHEQFRQCQKDVFMNYIKYIINTIVCMKLYPKYRNEINVLFKMIKESLSGWDEKTDVIKSWGLKDLEDLKTKLVVPKGANMTYIKKGVTVPDIETGKQLCVYGMAKSRGDGYDVLVSSKVMRDIIKSESQLKSLVIDIASVGSYATKYMYSIGFSNPMRTERGDDGKALKDTCVTVLQLILDNFDKVIKGDGETKVAHDDNEPESAFSTSDSVPRYINTISNTERRSVNVDEELARIRRERRG